MNQVKVFVYTILLLSLCWSCSRDKDDLEKENPIEEDNFIRGADLSFTPEIRESGTLYNYRSTPEDILDIFKEAGINTIRLRLWHTPENQHCNLEEVSAFASEIKTKGFDFLLDIHYSDTWADPGKQEKPEEWKLLNFNQLKDSVYNYTKSVLQTLEITGGKPDIVQIGNEINSGFLWNEGRIGGDFENNRHDFSSLLKAGLQAIKEHNPEIKTMIHFAGHQGIQWFFANLNQMEVDFDYIGISYYPAEHGKNLNELFQALALLNKPVIIVETAYPFTLDWNDQTHNLIGLPEQLIPGYPATPQGQADFISELIRRTKNLPDNKGIGVCYWAPDWVAYKGTQATDGSSMENQALFDFENNALPALDSLGKRG